MFSLFRIVGFLEGLSYVLLLFIAVPLKYLKGDPSAVKLLGMPHGLLFIAYITLAAFLSADLNWPKGRFFQAFLASLLPFGTFIFDKKFLKHRE